MNRAAAKSGGWPGSLRRFGESVLALFRNRLELMTVESQEEKPRQFNLLVWLALALGMTGLFVGLFALTFWLWIAAGYAGLLGLAATVLAAAGAILSTIRRSIQAGPPPFSQTLAEFNKDRECWRNDG